jgi:hypothetical protein
LRYNLTTAILPFTPQAHLTGLEQVLGFATSESPSRKKGYLQ